MPRKRVIWWLAEAMRLDAEGRTSREIAEVLRRKAKPGQKAPGQSTVFIKLRDAKGSLGRARAIALLEGALEILRGGA